MDKFRIRKRNEYFATILGIAGIALIYFLIINSALTNKVSFSPEDSIYIPKNCSNSEIEATWNSVFYESPTGITIIKNDTITQETCEQYFAYKIKDENNTYILSGLAKGTLNYPEITLYHSNFNSSFNTLISSFTNASNLSIILNLGKLQETILQEKVLKRTNSLALENATATFNFSIKITSSEFTPELIPSGESKYKFETPQLIGTVNANKSFESVSYSKTNSLDCSQTWIEEETDCLNRVKKIYFIPGNPTCLNESGRPQNQTLNCYGITSRNTRIEINVNNSELNLSQNYNGLNKVEILGSGKKLLEFEWNFSQSQVIEGVEIIKEETSSDFGYAIINGLNITKTVYITRKDNLSSNICIIDEVIRNVSEFSTSCTASEETKLNCPGNDSKYTCNITGNLFKITGLTHSGAKEITTSTSSTPSCTPIWNCSSWSSCSANKQTRTCNDLGPCEIPAEPSILEQSCTIQCIEDWKCGVWLPEKCPKTENQTRTCLDANSCGTFLTKPTEEQTCKYSNNTAVYITLLIILILIIIISIAIIYLIKTKDKSNNPLENSWNNQNSPISPNNQNIIQNLNKFPNQDPRRFYK